MQTMQPYFEDTESNIRVYHGDARDVLPQLDPVFTALVCDPPSGINFMNLKFDHDHGGRAGWVEAFASIFSLARAALLPGAPGLVWALPRTSHWTACALEDGGFRLIDKIAHCFGSGFPKSLSISKSIDLAEQRRWKSVIKAIDSMNGLDILEAWKRSSLAPSASIQFHIENEEDQKPTGKNYTAPSLAAPKQKESTSPLSPASNVEPRSLKNQTATGTNTPKRDSVPAPAMLPTKQKKSNAFVITVEIDFGDAPPISKNLSTAQDDAKPHIVTLIGDASFVESGFSEISTALATSFTALASVRVSASEKETDRTKDAEALKTWLGKAQSSSRVDINALCVAITNDLKRIILNQSKTFQSLDTNSQTAFASAMTVIITESTAERLITYMVDTLRSEAIDRAAGAEREVVGIRHPKYKTQNGTTFGGSEPLAAHWNDITAPATPDAATWEGWGTALSPGHEDWHLVMNPRDGTFANNCLTHKVGGLNIEGSRVGTDDNLNGGGYSGSRRDPGKAGERIRSGGKLYRGIGEFKQPTGRWPSNFLLSHSAACTPEHCADDCPVREMDRQSGVLTSGAKSPHHKRTAPKMGKNAYGSMEKDTVFTSKNQGGASRFFKTFWPENNEDTSRFFPVFFPDPPFLYCGKASKRDRGPGNNHATVKSTALMRWLVTLLRQPERNLYLDCFGGSGSTAVACKELGLPCVVIEMKEEHCATARRRLETTTASLFQERFATKAPPAAPAKTGDLFG